MKERTGVTPQGYGCLWAVFIWCLAPLLVALIVLFIVLIGIIGASIH